MSDTSADVSPGASPGASPVILIGEAVEDWTGDARLHEYSSAADPLATGAISPVPIHRFPAALHATSGTGVLALDLSDQLGTPYAATSPAMLAAFVVLESGDELTTTSDATSELWFWLEGSGTTTLTAPGRSPRPCPWSAGDLFVLPGGWTATHHSTPGHRSLAYRVTDAPLLAYLGVAPQTARFAPTLHRADVTRARLAEVEQDPEAATRSRISILVGNAATPQTLTATHTLWAMLGVLPAGQVQRPHRHQSAALDLIITCAPGCFTLVGSSIDGSGAIVDPQRVDWEAAGAFVTPPGQWHSHHNESGAPAYLLPVQDAGLHTYLRSLDIRFTPPAN